MSQIVSDDFNRANSTGLGANWTSVTNHFDIVSNQAVSNVAGDNQNVYTGASWTGGNDHYAEFAIISIVTTGQDTGPIVRSATASETFYYFALNYVDASVGLGSSFSCAVQKAPSFTVISSATITVSANDVLRLEANGTSLTAKVNGVTKIGPSSDSAIASGKPGMFGFGASATLDNFAAGDFAAAVTNVASAVGWHQRGPQGFGPQRRFIAQTRGFETAVVTTQTGTLGAVVTGEALQNPTGTLVVQLGCIPSAEQVQASSATQAGSIGAVASGEAFGTAAGTMAGTVGAVSSSEQAQVMTFARVFSPAAAIPTGEAFSGTTALNSGSVGAVPSAEVFYQMVAGVTVTVSLAVVPSAELFFAPTSLRSGSVGVVPSAEVFYQVIAGATVTVSLAVVPSGELFFAVSSLQSAASGAVQSGESFAGPVGARVVTLGTISSSEQAQAMTWTRVCAPGAAIPSGEVFPAMIGLSSGVLQVVPSGERFFTISGVGMVIDWSAVRLSILEHGNWEVEGNQVGFVVEERQTVFTAG